MTNLIATDLQGQEIDSGILDLFEIELPNGTKKFFHPGLSGALTDVKFRDKTNPGTINTYVAVPMMIEGLEIQADGALTRPTFTVANVTNAFTDELQYTNNDLVGQRLTRRQTLEKYLDDGTGNSANPPIELNSITYIIDRIAGENNLTVTFEVAVVYDLEGVSIPRRVVRGKYCPWIYQGKEIYGKGGCRWKPDSKTKYINTASAEISSTVFFDEHDNPLSSSSNVAANASTWSSSATGYTTSSYVFHSGTHYLSNFNHNASVSTTPGTLTGKAYWQKVRTYQGWANGRTYPVGELVQLQISTNGVDLNTVWYCKRAHTSSNDNKPALVSDFWRKEEICGKTINSCKCRFQAKVINDNQTNSLVSSEKDTKQVLPFGGFPGLSQF